MALEITGTRIASDEVSAYAEWRQHAAANGEGAWVVFGADTKMGGRLFDRNQAITAMTLEEEKARPVPDQALIASLASELWLDAEAQF
jgi:hypothetical protein